MYIKLTCDNDSLTGLHTLDLSNNQIEEVTDVMWSSLDNLTELNLAANLITVLHPNSFNTLPKLQSLYLDNNLIDHIELGAMAHLPPHLTHLGLSDNLLEEIPHELLVYGYPSQADSERNNSLTVNLKLNPLQCTPELCVANDVRLHVDIQLSGYCPPDWDTTLEIYMSGVCNNGPKMPSSRR